MNKSRRQAVVDAEHQVLKCLRCGEVIPIPLGAVRWVCGVMRLFDLEHARCKPGDQGRCLFSKPVRSPQTTTPIDKPAEGG